MGIFFAFIALFSWGLGDFLIQKSARKFGDWVALFYIDILAAVVLLPWVWKDLSVLWHNPQDLFILSIASVVILLAALLNFEALKRGKISVIEPIFALEVPVTILLATVILNEWLTFWQGGLITALMLGIFLVATKSWSSLARIKFEKGVFLAMVGMITMGAVNFLFGVGARQTSPILINWFTSLISVLVVTGYLASQSRLSEIIRDWHSHKKLILGVSIFDNLAWVTYSYSMLYIPIAVATSISESYIALAASLGLIFNREKLKRHQWFGLVICVIAVVILAVIMDK